MSEDKTDIVHSSRRNHVGRAVSRARGQALVLDSSSHPHDDAMTNSEAFLAGISSCGVTLIELHAEEQGVPLASLNVTIEAVRPGTDPSRFERVAMTFEFAGVDQAQADALLEVYRHR